MSRVSFIEIEVPRCQLDFATCGATGIECYNTLATCRLTSVYDEELVTLQLCTSTIDMFDMLDAIPNIKSVEYTPSEIRLGESFGVRSTLTILCKDHPFPDTGIVGDDYLDTRSYDPYITGTFWGKFKARYKYMRGHKLTWYIGNAGDPLENMEKRVFVIDKIEGPHTSGQVTIVAKDPLVMLDDKRSQAPRLTSGVLVADISDSDLSFTVEPVGIGDEQYPASGYVAIGGKEIVSFTRAGDVFTITRAQYNTEAVGHSEADRVQLCLVYDGEEVQDILYDIMTTYGNIPTRYIYFDSWDDECGTFLNMLYSGVVAEPTAVKTLVNELLEQCAISMWYDELDEKIQVQVLRNIPVPTEPYDDNVILADTFRQDELSDKRVSQVWFYYGKINPLGGSDDASNYRVSLATVSLDSEERYGTPAIKKIFSRWIIPFGRTQAERVSKLILSRYSIPPLRYEFALLRGSGVERPVLGSGRKVLSYFTQGESGEIEEKRTQIVSVQTTDATWGVRVEEVNVSDEIDIDDPTIKTVPIDSSMNNINLREIYLQLYPEATTGDTIICQIRSGVIIGSDSTSRYAFDVGTGWPAGITIQVVIEAGAYIVGAGGNGGNAVIRQQNVSQIVMPEFISKSSVSNGTSGGPAFLTTVPVEVENDGVIAGGAGGGGGCACIDTDGFLVVRVATAAAGGSGGASFGSLGTASTAWIGETSAGNGYNGGHLEGGASRVVRETDTGWTNQAVAIARGGKGGNIGQAGSAGNYSGDAGKNGSGGAAGNAVVGDALVTWTTLGDVRGNRV